MSKWESKLISKAVQEGTANDLIAKGIEARHFDSKENKAIWDFVTDHIRTYKEQPTFETVKENFDEFKWEIVTENLEFVENQFITEVKRREAVGAFTDLANIIDENDPKEIYKIDEIFLDKAKDLAQIVPSSHISKFSEMEKRIEEYRERKKQGIQIGMPFGFDKLDEITLGVQKHQYITIAGWTGVGKSTLGMIFSVHHHACGYTPMIVSLEMDQEEIYRKIDSIAVGLKQHAMKEMTLSPNDMKRWEKYAERLDEAKNDIIIVDVDFATPEKVYAETARWNPDIVVVDYVQLMNAPKHLKSTYEQVGYVSKMLKSQARSLRIPIYGIAQTNAEGATDGGLTINLGGSKDIGRHSDIVIGLRQDETMFDINKMDLVVDKNRAGPKGVIPLYWNQATAEFRQWKPEDAYAKTEV